MSDTPSAPFSDAEIAAFRREDRSAATVMVVMMVAIFAAGLALYVAICWLIL